MVWLSIFDVVKSNRDLAGKIWDQADQFKIDQNLCFLLVNDVVLYPGDSEDFLQEIRRACYCQR